jgi:hypothetical protein
MEEFIRWLKLYRAKGLNSHKVALFEMQVTFPAYIGYSYFARVLLKQDCQLVGYFPKNDFGIKSEFLFRILRIFPIDNGLNWSFRVFRSFGVTRFILPKRKSKRNLQIDSLFQEFISLEKNQMLEWKIGETVLGDLFYDWHLRRRSLATLSLDNSRLAEDFSEFISTYFWWEKYFSKNQVDSVYVSHTVYTQAILVRLGISHDAKVFLVGADRLYRLSEKDPFSDKEFIYYDPSSKSQFGYEIDIQRGHQLIESLKAGNSQVSSAHSLVSGYSGSQKLNSLNPEAEIRILIAAHCFSDNPHAMGINLFPDFYEWIHFLGSVAQKKDSRIAWYIKEHPAFNDSDSSHFNEILESYPEITIINSEVSNLELFNNGIDVVLTTYGTIAFEASYEGVLVINSSINAPHVNYSFSLSPFSIGEYADALDRIHEILPSHRIDKDSVAHFFDLHHVRRSSNLYFSDNYQDLLDFIGGYENLFASSDVLHFWIKRTISEELDAEFLSVIEKFYGGGDYLLFSAK